MADLKTMVLVVDDEETVRVLLQQILQAAGYEAAIAANGEEALSVIANGGIDVVMLDVNMPGLSGVEVLGKISTDWPDLCVIMVTAVADVQNAVTAMKLGAYDYIAKPFNQDEALCKIRQAVMNWQERLKLKQGIAEKTKQL